MFFNYDSFELMAIAFVISGIFIYSYSSATLNNESLVNTLPNPDLSNNLSNTSTQLIDAGVQTEANIQVEASIQAVNTYVNTGMQTSVRMWYETVRNWITEIPGTTTNPQYVDVGVRSSELSSMGYNKVEKWRNTIDSTQSVSLHDSESPFRKY
jgi:hypothetical protein